MSKNVVVEFEDPDLVMPYLKDRRMRYDFDMIPRSLKGPAVIRTHPTVILRQHCSDCIFCLETCPNLEYDQPNRTMVLNETACKGCGLCIAACPTGAMQQRNSWFGLVQARVSTALGGEREVPTHCNNCHLRTVDMRPLTPFGSKDEAPVIRLMCSGRMEPGVVLEALGLGCKGVFICGCFFDVDFFNKNEDIVAPRLELVKRIMGMLGIPEGSVRYERTSMASEDCRKALDELSEMVWTLD